MGASSASERSIYAPPETTNTQDTNAAKKHVAMRGNDAKHRSRSHDAVIRVYDEAGNVIETQEHKHDFKER